MCGLTTTFWSAVVDFQLGEGFTKDHLVKELDEDGVDLIGGQQGGAVAQAR